MWMMSTINTTVEALNSESSSEAHLSNDNNNREDWHSLCARMELNTKQLSEPFFAIFAACFVDFAQSLQMHVCLALCGLRVLSNMQETHPHYRDMRTLLVATKTLLELP